MQTHADDARQNLRFAEQKGRVSVFRSGELDRDGKTILEALKRAEIPK